MQVRAPSPFTNDHNRLLTTAQAAAFLSLSPRTLEMFRVKGGGPLFVALGRGRGAVRYRQGDLEQHVEERLRERTPGTRAAGAGGGG